MQTNLSINGVCNKCNGYKFAPYNSNLSATVKLCHCKKEIINPPIIDFTGPTRLNESEVEYVEWNKKEKLWKKTQ